MRFRSQVIAGLAAALAFAGACAPGAPPGSGDMKFRVDPARIGEAFTDPAGTLSVSPPARWLAVERATLDEAMRRVRDPAGAGSDPALLAFYREPGEGASFVVSGYGREFPAPGRDSLASAHHAGLISGFPGAEVSEGRFTYRGFDVIQFRVVSEEQVMFKLLVSRPRRPLLQLDYVVPRGAYPRELESIESSIGSLRPGS